MALALEDPGVSGSTIKRGAKTIVGLISAAGGAAPSEDLFGQVADVVGVGAAEVLVGVPPSRQKEGRNIVGGAGKTLPFDEGHHLTPPAGAGTPEPEAIGFTDEEGVTHAPAPAGHGDGPLEHDEDEGGVARTKKRAGGSCPKDSSYCSDGHGGRARCGGRSAQSRGPTTGYD